MITAAAQRRPSGFTLIELMVVTGIIGVLASVAIPAYTRLTIRSRTAERPLMMNSIKRGVVGLYVRDGKVTAVGGANPAGARPPGTTKLAFNNRLDAGWAMLSQLVEFEGAVYYQYDFTTTEPGGAANATLTIHAAGDLDGDDNISDRTVYYERQNGQYWTDENDTTDHWCVTTPGAGCVDDMSTF